MVSSFVNPRINNSSALGLNLFEDTAPIILLDTASEAEIEIVIRAIYRHVLGNVHIMDSERLTTYETQLKNNNITVREFVRALAKSELYRSRFFDSCPQNRAIELNFKHLLGRAPESYEEFCQHTAVLAEEGYEAEIDSYLDSDEYVDAFGDNTVPYYRGYKTQTGKNLVGFTHLLKILRGSASSDRSTYTGNTSRLNYAIMSNTPSRQEVLNKVLPPTKPAWHPSNQITDTSELLAEVLGLKQEPLEVTPQNSSDPNQILKAQQEALQNQYKSFEDTDPIEFLSGDSDGEAEIVIRAVYRQVLGNAHVMESERLTVPESQLKRGEISVREFVRQVAKSELYRSRFFDICPRYRSIELNFKHLLGRAPFDYSETFSHSAILDQGGFEAEIDSYIDSDEYQDAFGENIVPYNRGYKTQTGQKLLGFTNMFKLLKSVSTSDKAGTSQNEARLIKPLIYNNPEGKAPVSDVNALIAEALKPRPWMIGRKPVLSTEQADIPEYPELERKCNEQEEIIDTLKQQLADLAPLASIGISQLSPWQSDSSDGTGTSTSLPQIPQPPMNRYEELTKKSEDLEETIASLQSQIADAQRYATIATAKLNKWRSRSYG